MVYPISKYVFWPFIRLFVKDIRGLENLPRPPCILVCNHESYMDGFLLMMLIARHTNKKLFMFATNEKFLWFPWNILFNHYGAIRIDHSLEKGLATLSQRNYLAIFPEAGRTPTGKIQPVKHKGLGILALLSRAPIVPIGINTYDFWNKHHYFPTFKKTIKITIGKPRMFKAKLTDKNAWNIVKTVMNEVNALARISHT